MPETEAPANPFAAYSDEDRDSIREQLLALQSTGKLNDAQKVGVSRAIGLLTKHTNPNVATISAYEPGIFERARRYAGNMLDQVQNGSIFGRNSGFTIPGYRVAQEASKSIGAEAEKQGGYEAADYEASLRKEYAKRGQQVTDDQVKKEVAAHVAQKFPGGKPLDTPMLDLSTGVETQVMKDPQYRKRGLDGVSVIEGLGMASADTISGLTTPKNLAILGALTLLPAVGYGLLIKRLVAGGFSIQMAKGAADQLVEGYKASRDGDATSATRYFTGGLVSGALSVLAGTEAGGVVRGRIGKNAEGKTTYYEKPGPAETGKPLSKSFSLATVGQLEKLGYTAEQINTLQPEAADAIVRNKVKASEYRFAPPPTAAPAAPPAAAAPAPQAKAAGASAAPTMELAPEQLRAAGQFTRGQQLEMDRLAYDEGHGNWRQLLAIAKQKEAAGAELSAGEKRALDVADGHKTVPDESAREAAQHELDRLAYQAGYGTPEEYVKAIREKKVENAYAERVMKIALEPEPPTSQYKYEPPDAPQQGSLIGKEPPAPPSTKSEPMEPPVPGAVQVPDNTPMPRIPEAPQTMGPFDTKQVAWFTSLFEGRKPMDVLSFDVEGGFYGDTDAALQQMEAGGLIEKVGSTKVPVKGQSPKSYPKYRLTEEGQRLSRAWKSQEFPGKAPEAQAPQAQPSTGGEAAPAAPPAGPTSTRANEPPQPAVPAAPASPPPSTEAAPVPVAAQQSQVDAPAALRSVGLLEKGNFEGKVFQMEHPAYPGLTSSFKLEELERAPDKAQFLRDKMRHTLLKFKQAGKIKEIPADLLQSREVYKSGETVSGVPGRETVIHTPDGEYKANYRVVEAEELQPSHREGQSFQPNEKYPPGVQERQYHRNKNAQAEVDRYAREKKWELYVNTDPTAISGPSQSLPDGTVLGGNGRTMGLQRAYRAGDLSYKKYLVEHASEFGVDPAKVAEMKHPVLDRVIQEAPKNIDDLRRIGRDLNRDFKKALTAEEEGVSAGKNLSIESAERIAETLTKLGDEASLRKAMAEDPLMFRDILLRDGIVREAELPKYFDEDGVLNDAGKNFVENAMLGSVVNDPNLLASTPPAIKSKIERALAPLVELSHRTDGWNILPDLREAIRAHIRAKANGSNIRDQVAQSGFDEQGNMLPPLPDRVVSLALALARKPTEVGAMFKRFASEARQDVAGQDNMFGTPDPGEAFKRIFEGEGKGGSAAATAFKDRGKRRPGIGEPPPPPPKDVAMIPAKPQGNVASEFVTQDVVPKTRDLARNFAETARTIRNTFSPVTPGEISERASLIVRQKSAQRAEQIELARMKMDETRDFFQKFNREERAFNLSLVDAGKGKELAARYGKPELEQLVNVMRQVRERLFEEANRRRGSEITQRADYNLAHLYVTEDGTPLSTVIQSRKPLEGSKAFTKRRYFPTMGEMIQWSRDNYGVEVRPAFENPVDFEMAKVGELAKFIEGHDIVQEAKSSGLTRFVHALSMDIPDGYRIVKDPAFTVYAPPTVTVTEAYDQLLFERINTFARKIGITHYRQVAIGGDRWGYAEMGGRNRIFSKVGGPERVITHEIGHILDDKYNLSKRWVNDPFIKQELRDLADMRSEGRQPSSAYQKYIRKGTEKIANLVDAYVHNPEMARNVAPTAVKFIEKLIDDNPELKGLREIKPSQTLGEASHEMDTGTLRTLGYWAVPDQAATIFERHLSSGLSKNAPFRMYQFVANMMNQVQLGWSAFHLTFTGNDTAISKMALGIQELASGKVKKGLVDVAKGNIVTGTWETFMHGSKMLKEFYERNTQGQFYTDAINGLIDAGGRVKMDSFYYNSAVESFWDAWHSGNKLGAVPRAFPAMIEEVAKPIMEWWVPRMKLGVFAELANFEIEKLGPDATAWDRRAVLARAWDSVDNRLGQVVYDNLFWNRSLKDLGLASVRSLGWNLGTFREFGGAAVDLTRGIRGAVTGKGKFEVTPRMAYAIAVPIVMGMQGAVLHYLMTGKAPEELKDYYFPKTGKTNSDGTPERVALPSYVKDIYAYGSGFQRGAGEGVDQFATTLSHKIHPFLSTIYEMLHNQDFYGQEIRNADDPIVQQWGDVMKYIGEQFVPFSVRNTARRLEATGKEGMSGVFSLEAVESIFGMTPAPKSVDRTNAEMLAAEYAAETMPRGARSRQEFERTKVRNEIVTALRQNDPDAAAKVDAAAAGGMLSQADLPVIRRKLRYTWLQTMVQRLNLKRALAVYDAGSAEEKAALRPVLQHKVQSLKFLPPEQRQEMMEKLRDAIGTDTGGAPPGSAVGQPPPSPPY